MQWRSVDSKPSTTQMHRSVCEKDNDQLTNGTSEDTWERKVKKAKQKSCRNSKKKANFAEKKCGEVSSNRGSVEIQRGARRKQGGHKR